MHPKQEKTLVIIKPDGVQRTLIGEIIKRIERAGLKLVAIKMIIPDSEMIKKHYLVDPEWLMKVGQKTLENYEKKNVVPEDSDPVKIGEKVLGRLQKYMTSGPVIAMIWQGAHSVPVVRKIVGGTEPMSSDVGTIRGDLVLDSYIMSDFDSRSVRNLVHASGHVDEAEKEIEIWFDKKEIVEYRLIQEQILYDVNLDGILE
jgi:nucleoside-diphosphate kinase